MMFMVIEHFDKNDMIPVYRRLRSAGRPCPRGWPITAAGSNPTSRAASS
ncbi:DUF3303 family protein [Seohaeicola zhoushanensis]